MNISDAAAHAGFREELRAGARHVAARAESQGGVAAPGAPIAAEERVVPQVAVAEPDEPAAAGVVPPAAALVLNASVEEPDVLVGVAAVIPGAAAEPDALVGAWAELQAAVAGPDEQAAVRAGSLVLAA